MDQHAADERVQLERLWREAHIHEHRTRHNQSDVVRQENTVTKTPNQTAKTSNAAIKPTPPELSKFNINENSGKITNLLLKLDLIFIFF